MSKRHSGPCNDAEKQTDAVRSAHMPDPLGLRGRWRAPHPPEGTGTACKPAMKMPDFPWKFITLKQSRLLWSKEARKGVNAIRKRKLGQKRKCPESVKVLLRAGQPGWTQGIPCLWVGEALFLGVPLISCLHMLSDCETVASVTQLYK